MPKVTFEYRDPRGGYVIDHSFTVTHSGAANQFCRGLTHDGRFIWTITDGVSGSVRLLKFDPATRTECAAPVNIPNSSTYTAKDLVFDGRQFYVVIRSAGLSYIQRTGPRGEDWGRWVSGGDGTYRGIAHDGKNIYIVYTDLAFGTFGTANFAQWHINPAVFVGSAQFGVGGSTLPLVGGTLGAGLVCMGDGTFVFHSDTQQYAAFAGALQSFSRLYWTGGLGSSALVSGAESVVSDGPNSSRQGPITTDGRCIITMESVP